MGAKTLRLFGWTWLALRRVDSGSLFFILRFILVLLCVCERETLNPSNPVINLPLLYRLIFFPVGLLPQFTFYGYYNVWSGTQGARETLRITAMAGGFGMGMPWLIILIPSPLSICQTEMDIEMNIELSVLAVLCCGISRRLYPLHAVLSTIRNALILWGYLAA